MNCSETVSLSPSRGRNDNAFFFWVCRVALRKYVFRFRSYSLVENVFLLRNEILEKHLTVNVGEVGASALAKISACQKVR